MRAKEGDPRYPERDYEHDHLEHAGGDCRVVAPGDRDLDRLSDVNSALRELRDISRGAKKGQRGSFYFIFLMRSLVPEHFIFYS